MTTITPPQLKGCPVKREGRGDEEKYAHLEAGTRVPGWRVVGEAGEAGGVGEKVLGWSPEGVPDIDLFWEPGLTDPSLGEGTDRCVETAGQISTQVKKWQFKLFKEKTIL